MNRTSAKRGSVARRNFGAIPQAAAFLPCGFAMAMSTVRKTDPMKTRPSAAVQVSPLTNHIRPVTSTSFAV